MSVGLRPAGLILSHDMSAEEDVEGGGNTMPAPDGLIQGGHLQTFTTAMRGNDADAQPQGAYTAGGTFATQPLMGNRCAPYGRRVLRDLLRGSVE
jgi:hypothetical protein